MCAREKCKKPTFQFSFIHHYDNNAIYNFCCWFFFVGRMNFFFCTTTKKNFVLYINFESINRSIGQMWFYNRFMVAVVCVCVLYVLIDWFIYLFIYTNWCIWPMFLASSMDQSHNVFQFATWWYAKYFFETSTNNWHTSSFESSYILWCLFFQC